MKWSETTDKIASALAAFMAEAPNIPKSSTARVQMKAGGNYSFDFADLARVRKTIQPVLAKHGLFFSSGSDVGDAQGALDVTTRVGHASGQWVEQTIRVWPDNGTPQGIGSAQTYGVRYNVTALLGLAAEGEDDDGNAGSGNRANITPKGATPQPQQRPAAPAPTQGGGKLGPVFITNLLARMEQLQMTTSELREIMLGAGVDAAACPSPDPATWDVGLKDRIKAYIEKQLAK